MRIFRSTAEVPADFGPSALTIGNFDGVHAGHRLILARLTDAARANGWRPSALMFHPHPTAVVAPSRTPKLMTTPEERCRLMSDAGIDQALILPFTAETALWTPEEFVERIVAEALGARAVFVGDNFRFGNKQAGDVATLSSLGETYGFTTHTTAAVERNGVTVSSSEVRAAAETGRMNHTRHLLGRPFSLTGDVVSGHGIGSKQTVPTLNLAPDTVLMPAAGVYITRTTDLDHGRTWPSVTNAGNRPTFSGDAFSVETFLLRDLGGETPKRIRVEFLRRLRDERKFPSPEALKEQILRDAGQASRYHQKVEWMNTL